MRYSTLIVVTCLMWPVSARSDYQAFENGNALYKHCEARDSFCADYLEGVADTLISVDIGCVPAGVTAGQMRDVITKYLNNHPETRRYVAASLVYLALDEAFGCKKLEP